MKLARLLMVLALGLPLGACVNQTITTNEVPQVATASAAVPEASRLRRPIVKPSRLIRRLASI